MGRGSATVNVQRHKAPKQRVACVCGLRVCLAHHACLLQAHHSSASVC